MALLVRPGKVPEAAPAMTARARPGAAGVALLVRPGKVPGVVPLQTGTGQGARGRSNARSCRLCPPHAPQQGTGSGAGDDGEGNTGSCQHGSPCAPRQGTGSGAGADRQKTGRTGTEQRTWSGAVDGGAGDSGEGDTRSRRRDPPCAPRQGTGSGADADRHGVGHTGTEQRQELPEWPSLRAPARYQEQRR